METVAKQLFQTVKDHYNDSIKQMLYNSIVYCYENASGTEEDEEEYEEEFTPTHFPNLPCVFHVVNDKGYYNAMAAPSKGCNQMS